MNLPAASLTQRLAAILAGDGVNVASRLQTLARPGGIAISDAVQGVVRSKVDAHFTDQGQHRLKNIDRPVRVFTVDLHGSAGASPGQPKLDGAAQHPPATESASANTMAAQHASALFVGRRKEMAELAAALVSARSGRGQVMMLAGSGGMGKTRLAQQLADLIRVGDAPTLRRLLDQGLHIANESRAPYLLTLCRHTEALVAINEGRFDDAEVWTQQALESGRRLAEDQAASAFGMQMFCLRREQGRLREALPMLEHFVRNTEQSRTWRPGLALLYAEVDMREPCQAQFDSLPWDRATDAPRDVSTMTVVLFAAEICTYLADTKRAQLLLPLLQPLAGSQLMADFGGPCLGSADRLLGNLAGVMRQWTVAQDHFEQALENNRAAGSQVWLAHTGHDYAVMLLRRQSDGDAEKARALLDAALAQSTAMGMAALTPRIAGEPRPSSPWSRT